MPIADLVCLATLPLLLWVSFAFFARSQARLALKRSGAASDGPRDNTEGAGQLWATFGLVSFSLVLIAVALWARARNMGLIRSILNPFHWEFVIFHGLIFGLAFGGILLVFGRIFPEVGKIRLLTITGVTAPASVQTAGLLFVVFTEEFWRAVCLKALIADGAPGTQAWIVTSVVYGITFLLWGTRTAVSEGIVGTILGALFLWSGSFFVAFVAHFTLEGHILLYRSATAPRPEAAGARPRRYATCPQCGKDLNIRQVKLKRGESFLCPSCHGQITVSNRRRRFDRWGLLLVELAFMAAFWEILPHGLSSSVGQFWISMMLAFCAAIGLWSIVQVAIPPSLECGDPYIVRLNIEEQKPKIPGQEENSNPDGSSQQ